eukprot:scaffold72689_cov28-Tisochrysis_lutea.AAC.2
MASRTGTSGVAVGQRSNNSPAAPVRATEKRMPAAHGSSAPIRFSDALEAGTASVAQFLEPARGGVSAIGTGSEMYL